MATAGSRREHDQVAHGQDDQHVLRQAGGRARLFRRGVLGCRSCPSCSSVRSAPGQQQLQAAVVEFLPHQGPAARRQGKRRSKCPWGSRAAGSRRWRAGAAGGARPAPPARPGHRRARSGPTAPRQRHLDQDLVAVANTSTGGSQRAGSVRPASRRTGAACGRPARAGRRSRPHPGAGLRRSSGVPPRGAVVRDVGRTPPRCNPRRPPILSRCRASARRFDERYYRRFYRNPAPGRDPASCGAVPT